MIKVLNLYAGIGGNRKLWTDCHVTAVEINPSIASFYKKQHPDDAVVVGDAHEYLIRNFKQFDVIWSSVPCQSHSRARFWNRKLEPVYPDMKIYQEIILLQNFFKGQWIVENVKPYYTPLIEPTRKIGRHLFWSSKSLSNVKPMDLDIVNGKRGEYEKQLGISLGDHSFSTRTDQILRNCVHPKVGKDAFDELANFKIEKQLPLWHGR